MESISSKAEALEILNNILAAKNFDIFSGVFKEDRKLNKEDIKIGRIVFITKPISSRRR